MLRRRRYIYITEDEVRRAAKDIREGPRPEELEKELKEANQWAMEKGITTPPFPSVTSNRRSVWRRRGEGKKKIPTQR